MPEDSPEDERLAHTASQDHPLAPVVRLVSFVYITVAHIRPCFVLVINNINVSH